MNIEIYTGTVMVSSWLPEFGYPGGVMIPIEDILRTHSNDPKSDSICLSTGVERSKIGIFVEVALV